MADLSVHAFDLIVPGGQLSLPVPLLAQPLPFCKHPSQQPLPNHDLTLHHTNQYRGQGVNNLSLTGLVVPNT